MSFAFSNISVQLPDSSARPPSFGVGPFRRARAPLNLAVGLLSAPYA